MNFHYIARPVCCLLAVLFCDCALVAPSTFGQSTNNSIEWPEYRGPNGDGHSTATNLPAKVDRDTHCTWQVNRPGRAWSTPVIAGDSIWLTTAVETKAATKKDAPKQAKKRSKGYAGESAFEKVELKLLRVDRKSGKLEAEIDLFTIDDPPLIHTLNSFASPTPVINQKFVFAHFGTFGTAAIDRSNNEVVWRTSEYPLEHETGPGSSPYLFDDLLILHCDGTDLQFVVALDTETGKQVWKTGRSGELHSNPMYKKAFCTPLVVRRDDRDELISVGANWVYGYEPRTGKELWKLSFGQLGFSNVARPIVRGKTLYVCTCFMKSKILAIDVSGSAPIDESNVKWSYDKQVPNMPSPIHVDGHLFFVNDRGVATCIDADSGEKKWTSRLGGGFSSSPMLADNKIYVGNQQGQLFVLAPDSADLTKLAVNELDSAIMASPVAVGETLFVRTEKSLYRFEKR